MQRAEEKASVFDSSDDGAVPPEIVKLLPYDMHLDKMMPRKNATPADGAAWSVEKAGESMDLRAPNCVTMERSSHNDVDSNQIAAEALASLSGGNVARPGRAAKSARHNSRPGSADELIPDSAPEIYWSKILGLVLVEGYVAVAGHGAKVPATCRRTHVAATTNAATLELHLKSMDPRITAASNAGMMKYIVTTGTQMINQFEPWFFAIAFPFCFKYGVGMPDMPEWTERSRHRRAEGAPRVELAMWTRIMTRRVESQFRRDWRFGFAMSSLLFQSSINMA
jgi:hypothetical protein